VSKSEHNKKRKHNWSVYFAPETMKNELLEKNEIIQHQDVYIENIKKLNNENAELTDRFTYIKKNKTSALHFLFEDMTISLVNVMKFLTIIVLCVLTSTYIFAPILSGKVPFALASDFKKSISSNQSFGSGSPVESLRADPSFAQNVTVISHGEKTVQNTTESTVRDFLRSKKIAIGYGEAVYPSLDTPIGDNSVIAVDKVESRSESDRETLAHTEQRVDEPTLRKGEENVANAGEDGESLSTYIVHQVAGYEISRSLFAKMVTKSPVARVVQVGTADVFTNGTSVTVGGDDAKQFALNQLREKGLGDDQFSCLDKLWQRESGWRTHAGNIFSGAYGIPQALPGSKMAAYGDDWRDNAEVQIRWGLNYIEKRYGTPCSAWAHSEAFRWY
jgi:predicted nucleic-acid-binding protein